MAIHDQNYVRYDGPLKETSAWWTIATTTFRSAIKFTRTKLAILALWLPSLVAIVAVFAEYALLNSAVGAQMGEGGPDGAAVSYAVYVSMCCVAILFIANGAGTISEDLRHRTFQLYFSKPIGKLDYTVGKFLGVFMLALLVVIPMTLVGALRMMLYTQSEHFSTVLTQTAIGYALGGAFTVILCALLLGLSATTSRTSQVVLAWVALLLVPAILSGIVTIASDGARHANLWSLFGNFRLVSEHLLTDDSKLEGTLYFAPVILVLVTVAGVGMLVARIRRLEGIA